MLILRRNGKVAENDDENEYVIHGKRILNEVAAQEFKRYLPGNGVCIEAGKSCQSRIPSEIPARINVKRSVEKQCQGYPDDTPCGGLSKTHFMRIAMKNSKIEGDQSQNPSWTPYVQPPVLCERKKNRHNLEFNELPKACRKKYPSCPLPPGITTFSNQRLLIANFATRWSLNFPFWVDRSVIG